MPTASNNCSRNCPSKIHENMLRIKVMYALVRFGYASAKNVLVFCSQHLGRNLGLSNDAIDNNKYGVEKELEFYTSLEKQYTLIPTLDAGCQFDFVGRRQGAVIAIDVCGGLSNKENMAIRFGSLRWQRYAVLVKYVKAEWYWTNTGCLSSAGLPTDRISIASNPKLACAAIERVPNAERFEFVRHFWLSRVAKNIRLSSLIEELNSSVGIDREIRILLIAQMKFFLTYRDALNLVATLSFVDGIDFVGQHGTQLVRYHIIVDYDECRNNEYQVLNTLPYSNDEYKIVRYDNDEKMFEFRSIDDPVFFA